MTEPRQPEVDTSVGDQQPAFREVFLWRLSEPDESGAIFRGEAR